MLNCQKRQIATAIAAAAIAGGIVTIGTPASAAPAPTSTVSIAQARVGDGLTQAQRLLPEQPCQHHAQGGDPGGGSGNSQGGTQGGGSNNTQGGTQG